uniref:Uncharacterized protein n=1 Tax=Oryza sativa subsp. japonica TaxID=39947 RepID=Q6H607_ORYSJ|nr:hypothetical protein [Oryza sativa Japonica Group]
MLDSIQGLKNSPQIFRMVDLVRPHDCTDARLSYGWSDDQCSAGGKKRGDWLGGTGTGDNVLLLRRRRPRLELPLNHTLSVSMIWQRSSGVIGVCHVLDPPSSCHSQLLDAHEESMK